MDNIKFQSIVFPKIWELERKFKNKLDKFAIKMNKSNIIEWIGHVVISNLFYIYLLNKYKSKCLVKHKIVEITKYTNLGIKLFLNYENIDQYENRMLDEVVKQLSKCIKRGVETIIIPLTLRIGESGHSNVLIYRKFNSSIEHFEPHGSNINIGEKKAFYEAVLYIKIMTFINRLNNHLKTEYDILTKVEFIPALHVCPSKKGLQILENEIQDTILANGNIETKGYCAAWSMFFTELALQNPTFTSEQLLTNVLKSTSFNPTYLKTLIRGYVLNICEKLEKYFRIFFGQTMQIDAINKIIRAGTKDEKKRIRNFMNEIIEMEMVLLNEEFDKDTFMKNIENEILLKQNKVDLVEKDIANNKKPIKKFLGLVKKPVKTFFELVDEKHTLDYELEKLYIKKKILENIHILEHANESAKLESALKPIDVNEILKCPEGKERNPKTGKCIIQKKTTKKEKEPTLPKECPEGKELNPETKKCIKPKNKTKKEKEPTLPKECPEGKERNPKTGKCKNINKTKKVKEPAVPKECPEGKELNPETKKCIKPKNKTKKVKEPTLPKECPEGKELNPKTKRCIKIKI